MYVIKLGQGRAQSCTLGRTCGSLIWQVKYSKLLHYAYKNYNNFNLNKGSVYWLHINHFLFQSSDFNWTFFIQTARNIPGGRRGGCTADNGLYFNKGRLHLKGGHFSGFSTVIQLKWVRISQIEVLKRIGKYVRNKLF